MLLTTLLLAREIQKGPTVDLTNEIKKALFPISSLSASAPFDDLRPLGKLLKDTRVVGVGEATHGTSEFCTMKHRLFRYLVEEQGFTVFGLEASMPDCIAMDDYVLNGKGDPKAAVINQGFWTWSTQEMLDLIEWMRAYNLDPKHKKKLRVIGFDMQSQVSGTIYFEKKEKELTGDTDSSLWENASYYPLDPESRKVVREKMDGLVAKITAKFGEDEGRRAKFVKSVYFQSERNTWTRALIELQMQTLPTMSDTFADASKLMEELKLPPGPALDGLKFIDDHKDKTVDPKPAEKSALSLKLAAQSSAMMNLVSKADEAQGKRLSRQSELLRFLSFGLTLPDDVEKTHGERISFRDKCMAENISRAQTELFPNQKMMVWAHNGHIMRLTQPQLNRPMGTYLSEHYKKAYFPIGFSFATGDFNAKTGNGDIVVHSVGEPKAGSLDDIFEKVGKPMFWVPTTVNIGERSARSIGAFFDSQKGDLFSMNLDPAKAFDAMIFVSKSSPTNLLK